MIKGSLLALRESRVWSCLAPFARGNGVRRPDAALARITPARSPVQTILGASEPICFPASLEHQIENFAFILSRSPQPELSARNRQGHFVEMPSRGRSIAKFSSKRRPECSKAFSHRLAGDNLPRAATKSSILRKPSVKHDVPVDRMRNNGVQKRSLPFAILAAKLNNAAVRVTKPVALRAQLTCYRPPRSSSTLLILHGRH